MVTDINDITRASLLYDFYGALLTEKQRSVMALYHEENLSLSEIADEYGISRQAVHDTLKKAEQALACKNGRRRKNHGDNTGCRRRTVHHGSGGTVPEKRELYGA